MRVIISINSDIGENLALHWQRMGFRVAGTYRNWNSNCDRLKDAGVEMVHCDLQESDSISKSTDQLLNISPWEVLVFASGDQKPIGKFEEIDIDDWKKSITSNFLGQIEMVHGLLRGRRPNSDFFPSVVFFAGGGTNSPVERYSAYTISKIALIKMCELLDFENQDCKFTIIGPGWVETKIHDATLEAGVLAGSNYMKTLEMRTGKKMNPMINVLVNIDWIIKQPKSVVGGRNFSSVHDNFKSESLINALKIDSNLFKLRRFGNELVFGGEVYE